MHLVKLRENTGHPGVVRNVGIQYARGKYIAFLDSDDLFTPTALEELTTLAEKYQADIVHLTDSFRLYPGEDLRPDDPRINNFSELTNPKNFGFTQWRWPIMPRPKPLDAPKLESDTLEERVKNWVSWKYRLGVCANFCRREFLITNQISFPDMVAAEDQVFNFACLCLAKNFLCAPNVVYIIRPRVGSASRENLNADFEKHFRKRVAAFNDVFNEFERIMEKIPFLRERKDYRYALLNWIAEQRIPFALQPIYAQVPAFKLNDFVKREFHPDNAVLAAYLFNTVNVQRLQIMKLQRENHMLKQAAR